MEAGRLDAYKAAPDAMRAVQRVEAYIQQCGLEKRLIELVKMRASQINGCAYCLHVHSKDARHGGETEQRLYLLDAWHESSLYTERERAALAWTEALTLIAETHAPDATYDARCRPPPGRCGSEHHAGCRDHLIPSRSRGCCLSCAPDVILP
jgi:AhpD family alkylhydroperoxidase